MDLGLLYDEFSRYPLKPKIEGCPCCDLESSESGLHKKELRDLGWDDLSLFIFKAMTTFGDVNDFKHFLPRIFELYYTSFYESHYDVGILFSKLEYANLAQWPKNEREIVLESIRNWLSELKVSSGEDSIEIYNEICSDIEKYGFSGSV
jgi:hypothetical protein